MPRWAEPRGIQYSSRVVILSLCLGGRSHEAYSSSFVCVSLCLGGRSHEAYCNRVVCLSVVLSVCYTIFAAHAGRYALKLAMQVEIDIISVVN